MTDGTHEDEENTEVAGRAEFALLGGVLSYSTAGHNKPCGQIVGVNGAGDFCLLINGTADAAEDAAREHIKNLEQEGHAITKAIFTRNDELASYYGNPIKVIAA